MKPSSLISIASASLLTGKPAASCALYAASCSLVIGGPGAIQLAGVTAGPGHLAGVRPVDPGARGGADGAAASGHKHQTCRGRGTACQRTGHLTARVARCQSSQAPSISRSPAASGGSVLWAGHA